MLKGRENEGAEVRKVRGNEERGSEGCNEKLGMGM